MFVVRGKTIRPGCLKVSQSAFLLYFQLIRHLAVKLLLDKSRMQRWLDITFNLHQVVKYPEAVEQNSTVDAHNE